MIKTKKELIEAKKSTLTAEEKNFLTNLKNLFTLEELKTREKWLEKHKKELLNQNFIGSPEWKIWKMQGGRRG